MSSEPQPTYQSLAGEYRDLVNKSGDQWGEELQKTLNRLKEIELLLREFDRAIPRSTGGSTNYYNKLSDRIIWIDATIQTPAQWAADNRWGNGEGRHKVKLQDDREIFSWWQDGQWSVERLMPHLKVAFWKRPVIIG